MPAKRRAYESTSVSVDKSRASIAKVLVAWGATGIAWEDDLRTGAATLRFRWCPGDDDRELVARLRLVPSVPVTNTEKQAAAALERDRRRLHRVAFHWLKAQHEAVEAGLFDATTVVMPWLEDSTGRTLGETVRPALAGLASIDVGRRLALTGK